MIAAAVGSGGGRRNSKLTEQTKKKKDQFKHLHDQDVLYEFIGAALV